MSKRHSPWMPILPYSAATSTFHFVDVTNPLSAKRVSNGREWNPSHSSVHPEKEGSDGDISCRFLLQFIPRKAKDVAVLRMCTPPFSGRRQNSAPQPESAAVARAVGPMHTGEESKDDGFGGSLQLPNFRDERVAHRKSAGEYDAEDDEEDDADFNLDDGGRDKDKDDDDGLPPDREVNTYTFFA